MKKIVIKYYSTKILLLTDLHKMFELIFEYFGECEILLEMMNSKEQSASSETSRGITLVQKNIFIYEETSSQLIRAKEIEKRIVLEGENIVN